MISIVLIAPFAPAGILPSSRLVPAISSFPIFFVHNDVYSFRRPAIFLATFFPVSPSLSWIVLRLLTFRFLRVSFFASADGEY